MPFRRHLSQDFVETLQNNVFWINVCSDRQLQPEIRNNVVTIYFCGQALVRELRLRSGVSTCFRSPQVRSSPESKPIT